MAELAPGDPILVGGAPALITLQFGEGSITKFMPLRKHTDGKYYRAKNNGTDDEAKAVVVALTGSSADGDYGTGIAIGYVNPGVALVQGTAYYLASTLGKIEPYADVASTEKLVKIMDAISSTLAFVNVRYFVPNILTGALQTKA